MRNSATTHRQNERNNALSTKSALLLKILSESSYFFHCAIQQGHEHCERVNVINRKSNARERERLIYCNDTTETQARKHIMLKQLIAKRTRVDADLTYMSAGCAR